MKPNAKLFKVRIQSNQIVRCKHRVSDVRCYSVSSLETTGIKICFKDLLRDVKKLDSWKRRVIFLSLCLVPSLTLPLKQVPGNVEFKSYRLLWISQGILGSCAYCCCILPLLRLSSSKSISLIIISPLFISRYLSKPSCTSALFMYMLLQTRIKAVNTANIKKNFSAVLYILNSA